MTNTATYPAYGAMTMEAMTSRLSSFPDYRAAAAMPAVRHTDVAASLWGARLRPIMADPAVQGRFAGAALPCPATACTGGAEMAAGASSRPYRNPAAAECLICLTGSLEVRYGPRLEGKVTLGRFDLLSIPAGVKHVLHNPTADKINYLAVLSANSAPDYSAIFDASDLADSLGKAAADLCVRFDAAPGEPIEAAALESRITRFEKLVPYKKNMSDASGIPPEATMMLSAGSVYPLLAPVGHVGRAKTVPIYGNQGLYLAIAECMSGDDGPPAHSHSDTQETFFVLEGEWDISTGFDNEYTVAANQFDIVAVPRNVMRSFRNRSNKPGRLFVIIQGPERMQDTLSYSRRLGDEMERRFGKEIIAAFEKTHMVFDAEERLKV